MQRELPRILFLLATDGDEPAGEGAVRALPPAQESALVRTYRDMMNQVHHTGHPR